MEGGGLVKRVKKFFEKLCALLVTLMAEWQKARSCYRRWKRRRALKKDPRAYFAARLRARKRFLASEELKSQKTRRRRNHRRSNRVLPMHNVHVVHAAR